jgi:hypothetical protein
MEKRYDANELGLLGSMFKFMDEHKTLSDIILFLEIAGLFWAVLNYNFTTNF